MNDRRAISQMRIDGRAIFSAAAYLISVGVIFLLERIGAPDGLVRVLGPILALGALVLIGALLRTTRVAAFYAADRAGSPLYGGAAFAAIAAGLMASASQGAQGLATPTFAALAVGFLLAALVVGPLARQTGASSLRDIVSARFDNRLLSLILGAAYFSVGVLIASVGYETAVDAVPALLGLSRDGAIIAVAIIVLLIVAPGGLAGLFWVAAAAAGMIVLVLALPIGLRIAADASLGAPLFGGGAEFAARLSRALGQYAVSPPAVPWLDATGVAIGAALLPPLSTGAFASLTAPQARRAGVFGAVLAIVFALALALGASLWPAYDGAAAQSLHSSALLVGALIAAAAGAQTASRAAGAHSAYGHEGVLASQRLARSRGLAIVAVALCAWLSHRQVIEPEKALLAAAALALALLGPPLALAVSARARALDAALAVLASLAAMAALAYAEAGALSLALAPTIALTGAVAGFAVGWAASAFGARRQSLEPARSQLFIEPPFDHGGA
jgi:cation/acetate symporter